MAGRWSGRGFRLHLGAPGRGSRSVAAPGRPSPSQPVRALSGDRSARIVGETGRDSAWCRYVSEPEAGAVVPA